MLVATVRHHELAAAVAMSCALGIAVRPLLGRTVVQLRSGLSEEVLESETLSLWYLFQILLFLFILVAGMLRTVVERLRSNQAKSWWRPMVASVLLLAPVSLFVIYPYLVRSPGSLSKGSFQIDLLESTAGTRETMVAIVFFASAVPGTPLLCGMLRWKPLAFVEVISYSMFLLHHTIVITVTNILPAAPSWAASEGTSLAV